MDATGQIGAMRKARQALPPRNMSLSTIALGGSAIAWSAVFVIILAVVLWNARDSVRNETQSAFQMATAAATLRLPTAFDRKDMMAEAVKLAVELRSQRHVTAELRDRSGKTIELPTPPSPAHPAPQWFSNLLRPDQLQDVITITQYPNVEGLLEIRTDPADEIAEVWRDLSVLVPLLFLTALAAIGTTLAVSSLVSRRLEALHNVLGHMREGDLEQRAPRSGLAELDSLGEGIGALASHLALERGENRRLQARMMTLAEAERARIASDLHDEMGPQLFALHAAVGQARRQGGSPEISDSLDAISRHSDAIRKSARAAIDDLRLTPTDGVSLPEMIQELVIEFEDIAPDICFAFQSDQDLPEPDEAGRIAIFRFVRESVLNALRHAGPGALWIDLALDGATLLARVSDDGAGPTPRDRRGLGQAGMRDRALALGAEWTAPQRRDGLTITEFRILLT
ncbi:LapD/MoxY N-terminal periplasmic domain-containing protein [Paracoccus sp. MBLB3053]|uniref:LapD/MoxY N-terminal periplasmic domain-containing protein n=1 Tax=Paracoccus aurantius TaxID=3073814 RepID=A0ABU2HVT6_9RHOB|nr:LapD/MoxY N-terminal periplasmic domain-containing protein [Paracoccus sp. MBLB3053]MDS9468630.1 LapD/MoxY N-terminal periplasmic domain-containing protein [Paracoccus sp. MBLB3053]